RVDLSDSLHAGGRMNSAKRRCGIQSAARMDRTATFVEWFGPLRGREGSRLAVIQEHSDARNDRVPTQRVTVPRGYRKPVSTLRKRLRRDLGVVGRDGSRYRPEQHDWLSGSGAKWGLSRSRHASTFERRQYAY